MNEVTDILQVLAMMADKITLLENKVQVLEKDIAQSDSLTGPYSNPVEAITDYWH
ncbi:hypothetical protein FACS1894160_2380 [Bacteroidia bacterium]|nr:hypothetical protein FACS1894160_2380 [Bacteroidia bacterium]